jgi:hypothetical protein
MKLAKTAVFLSVWTAAFMYVAPALAQSPSQSAYGCQGCTNLQDGGSLPFTGLNLTLLVLFGVLLVGVGFAVRRASRTRTD